MSAFLKGHVFKSSVLAAALFGCVGLGLSAPAEARGGYHGGHSHFSFSANIGLPLYPGYYGSGWYGPAYYPGPYFAPRYYYGPRPAYYRHYGYRPSYGPIVSLGLFPAYVGDSLTLDDRAIYSTAYRQALAAPIGESMVWNSGNINGAVTATRDGWAGQRYCREFRQEITIDGRDQEAYGTACQTPNCDWQLVQNQ